jgi:hypothetical protein
MTTLFSTAAKFSAVIEYNDHYNENVSYLYEHDRQNIRFATSFRTGKIIFYENMKTTITELEELTEFLKVLRDILKGMA